MSGPTNGGRSRAYEALRDSEELHRATLSAVSDAVFLTDDEGAFTFICPNVDVIFGYAPDEVQTMGRIGRLLGEGLFERADLAERGEIRNIERDVCDRGGARRTVLIHVKAVSIRGGTTLYTCRDVTERRRVQDELRSARLDLAHASRLALAGELLASITHEITQPLTAIQSNADAALRMLSADGGAAEVREIFGEIRSSGRRAVEIIDRLRSLVRKRPLDMGPLDVNEATLQLFHLVEGDARRRGVELSADLAPSLPPVRADRVGLQQVVLNLMLNAMDAMEDGGVRRLVVRTRQQAGEVEIAVSDTGPGIPAERMPLLFDAFFTTKKDGMGLGLAIARSIVETHGGRLWAEDRGGHGATFRLAMPAA